MELNLKVQASLCRPCLKAQLMNLHQKFNAVCKANGPKTALNISDGRTLRYSELQEISQRHASAMRAKGLTKGDRIVLQIEKSLEGAALYLACLQCGVILVPLNTAYTPAEVAYFLEDAAPKLFLHDGPIEASSIPNGVTAIALNDWRLLVDNQAPSLEVADCADDDTAAICYTSGTTGRSKGAMITHNNLRSNVEALHDIWRFTADDTLLHILPIFHVHGLFVALNCALFVGASIRFELGFDPERVCALLPRSTVMMGVPTHYTKLLDCPDFTKACTSNMRLFLSGSAPLHADTHKAFEAKTGLRILERYGMTEAGMITSNPYDGERLAGTVGYPLPGVSARVRGSDGDIVGPGSVGVLEAAGPNVFKAYWQKPEKTEETFTSDGWLITGDLVTQSEDGRITIVGREKDLIISGGYNIYPKEIEQVLDDHPAILESAVFGIPHKDFGESVVAAIVLNADASFSDDDMASWVDGKLARFKQPRHLQCLPALPRNAMGKVQKAQLRKEYAARQ